MRTSIHQLAEHPRVHDLCWPVVVEVTVLLAIDRPAERHRHLVALADVAGAVLMGSTPPERVIESLSWSAPPWIAPPVTPIDATQEVQGGGLVRRKEAVVE